MAILAVKITIPIFDRLPNTLNVVLHSHDYNQVLGICLMYRKNMNSRGLNPKYQYISIITSNTLVRKFHVEYVTISKTREVDINSIQRGCIGSRYSTNTYIFRKKLKKMFQSKYFLQLVFNQLYFTVIPMYLLS